MKERISFSKNVQCTIRSPKALKKRYNFCRAMCLCKANRQSPTEKFAMSLKNIDFYFRLPHIPKLCNSTLLVRFITFSSGKFRNTKSPKLR